MGALIFALIILSSELNADNASLSLRSSTSEIVGVGDTLLVNIQIDPRSSSLTSASVYLRYDYDLLEVISESFGSDREIIPFSNGSFWKANVYQNSLGGERGELNYVAVTGRDNNGSRIFRSVTGALAQVRFKVRETPELNRRAKVEIQMAGRRQSSYTLLTQPGVKHLFDFNKVGLEWGIVPIRPELSISTTKAVSEDVHSTNAISDGGRLSLLEDDLPKVYNWHDLIGVENPSVLNYVGISGGLVVEIVGDSLYLKGKPNYFGKEILELNVCDFSDECDSVKWEVEIEGLNDPPIFVNLAPVNIGQGESLNWPIDDIVFDVDNNINDLRINCKSSESILTSCGSDEVQIHGVSPGEEFVTLSATDPSGATAIFKWIVTVDPAKSVAPTVKNVFNGYRELGDVHQVDLREYISDDDSPWESMVLHIDSSGLIWDWHKSSSFIVELMFHEEGEVTLSLRVADPEGNESEGLLSWVVEKKHSLTTDQIPIDFNSSKREQYVFNNWELNASFVSNLLPGDSMLIPLETFTTGIDPEELDWNIGAQENVSAKIYEGFVKISAPLGGKDLGWFELSALDKKGYSKKICVEIYLMSEIHEQKTAKTESTQEVDLFWLGDIPDVSLSYGESLFIPLSQYTNSLVEWTYMGGEGLNVALAHSGATITSSDSVISQSVLLFTATDIFGNERTDVVRVKMLSRDVMKTVDQYQLEGNMERSAVEKSSETFIEGFEDITVNVGESVISEPLDKLLDIADFTNMSWSIRGGAYLDVTIDEDRRLVVNARNALVGREFFMVSGKSEKNLYEIPLTININERLVRLEKKTEYISASNDGFALNNLLIGEGEVEEWAVRSLETNAVVENGFLYVSGDPGLYGIEVEARLVEGRWIKGGFVNIEIGSNYDRKSMDENIDNRYFAPIFDMPPEFEIVVGDSAKWIVVVEDKDSSPDQLTISLIGKRGGFSLQDRQLFFDGSSAPDTLFLFVEDESGMTDEIAVKIQVRSIEVAPLEVFVEGDLQSDNTVTWKLKSNKPLAHIDILVDQQKIEVREFEKSTFLWNPLGVSRAKVDFIVRDFDGEIVELNHDVSIGRIGLGRGIYSADGNFRIEGEWQDSFALIYQDSMGYRVSLREGAAHVFMHVGGGFSSLAYYNSDSWQELLTEYGSGQLRAIIPRSGWVRIDSRRAPTITESVLIVYPNPFNSTVAIKLEIRKPDFIETAVFDVLGRKIRDFENAWREVGPSIIQWDGKDNEGRNVSSGIYFFSVRSGTVLASARMMLLR